MFTRTALAVASTALLCSAAAAQEPPYPTFSSFIATSTSFISTNNENSDDSQNASVALQPSMTLEWWNNVFLSGGLNVSDYPPADKDSFFEYEDVTVDNVNLFVTNWEWSVQAGKSSLPFGLAPSNAPGTFGSNFAGDYDFGGLIMAQGGYDFGQILAGGTAGSHNLLAGSFFVDTTFMSESAFGEVERTRLDDGGPANTENFDSYFVTYDASAVPLLPGGVNYRLSYIHEAAGRGDTGNERGYSIGAVVPVPLAGRDPLSSSSGDYVSILLVGEYAHFDDFGGVDAVDHDYYTAGIQTFMGQWFVTGSTTIRDIDDPVNGDQKDNLYALSAGYTFNNAMSVQAGYAYQDIPGGSSHIFGVTLNYTFALTESQSWWPNFGEPAYVQTNEQLLNNWHK